MSPPWSKILTDISHRHPTGYLVAVSGGVDSMFLLDILRRSRNIVFTVGHFNHHLRDDSEHEQMLVERYCAEHGLPLEVGHGDPEALKSAPSIEAAARSARYKWLREKMVEHGHARVMTAHHLDDQVETILLHLFREHRLFDFGMDFDNGFVYRPLLDVAKKDIITRAKQRGVMWAEDGSNTDTSFERNWYRHVVVPTIAQRRNPVALARKVNQEKLKKLIDHSL